MKKFIITGAALAMLAVPSMAIADAPDGEFAFKANDGARSANASAIGEQSSQIKQNGQHVGGNGLSDYDQTTSPGSRADAVQTALGH